MKIYHFNFTILILLVLNTIVFSQNPNQLELSYFNTITFDSLKNEILKSEIAYFSKVSYIKKKVRKLKELKLIESQNQSISYEKSNWISFEKVVKISIKKFDKFNRNLYFNDSVLYIDSLKVFGCLKTIPDYQIANIEYCLHNCYITASISNEALNGIYEPEINPNSCKVFSSLKGNRLYIYMLCGNRCKYEVIWVFESNNYLGRVINLL